MKRRLLPCFLWIAVAAGALASLNSCHTPKPLNKAPEKPKPAASDSSSKKIDTGPSEFFDGTGIRVKYPDAGMQKGDMSRMVCTAPIAQRK